MVAELGAGLCGGVGLAPGAHFGIESGRELAVFEATHGTAQRLSGTNQADPFGVMLSGAMMLRHMGETEAGDRLEASIVEVIAEGIHVPRDLRGPGDTRPPAGTFQAADAVITRL